jgi:hypothetical protein
VYVGSFVQAILKARGLGVPLTQSINGKESYGAWMIYPKGQDPKTILSEHPSEIAYATGASSGEGGAKAATQGAASMPTFNHGASARAVNSGKAKGAFVKNWWWEANSSKYSSLDVYQVPDVSDLGNPDNVLTAPIGISEADREAIQKAAMASASAFGAQSVEAFDGAAMNFSLGLMKMGEIDPTTYSWGGSSPAAGAR